MFPFPPCRCQRRGRADMPTAPRRLCPSILRKLGRPHRPCARASAEHEVLAHSFRPEAPTRPDRAAEMVRGRNLELLPVDTHVAVAPQVVTAASFACWPLSATAISSTPGLVSSPCETLTSTGLVELRGLALHSLPRRAWTARRGGRGQPAGTRCPMSNRSKQTRAPLGTSRRRRSTVGPPSGFSAPASPRPADASTWFEPAG